MKINYNHNDFTNMKTDNIFFNGMIMREFIYLRKMAEIGEAVKNTFSSGFKITSDDGQIIENEIELVNWNNDMEQGDFKNE